MKRVFIVVASGGHDTEVHFQDTIATKRSIDEIADYVSQDTKNDLQNIFKDGKFAAWGATPGEGNLQTWHRMKEGDYILIYRKKKFIAIGEVAHRLHNKKLAEFFWGRDKNGQTWEYMYFIINEEPINLPVERLNHYLDYSRDYFPQGFMGIAEEKLQRVNTRYGDFYDLIISLNQGRKIKKVQKVDEQLAAQIADLAEREYKTPEPTPHDEMQWYLIKIGLASGDDVWVARNDRSRRFQKETFGEITLPKLPSIGLDPDSSRTVEYIDTVWLKGRRVRSAFEIEHSTSIYSGILRLSDLKVLQPNTTFPLYVVASEEKKPKVERELKRPTFSNDYLHLDRDVRFISYDRVKDVYQYVDKGYGVAEDVFEKISEGFGD
jgi:hypothetical protein